VAKIQASRSFLHKKTKEKSSMMNCKLF